MSILRQKHKAYNHAVYHLSQEISVNFHNKITLEWEKCDLSGMVVGARFTIMLISWDFLHTTFSRVHTKWVRKDRQRDRQTVSSEQQHCRHK